MAASADEKNTSAKPQSEEEEDEFRRGKAPLKYIPLCDVYSATSPCSVTASGSKKVKASAAAPPKIDGCDHSNFCNKIRPLVNHVYSRRNKRKDRNVLHSTEEIDELGLEIVLKRRKFEERIELETCDGFDRVVDSRNCVKSRKANNGVFTPDGEDRKLRNGCVKSEDRKLRNGCVGNGLKSEDRKLRNGCVGSDLKSSEAARTKKWVWLSFDGVDPKKFVGLQCKIYWPLDAAWYSGSIVSYISETGRHHVKYVDGEEENLILSNERIKFHISFEEMRSLKLKCNDKSSDVDGIDVNELMVLAATLDDSLEIEPGDIIWAKLTGHAVWPAVVLDESHVRARKGLSRISGEKSVLVQFFGTHDFARVTRKQVVSFLKGLLSSCHLKCKKPAFVRGLEEAKMYLSEQKLPKRMLQLRDSVEAYNNDNGNGGHEDGADSGDEECMSHDEIRRKLEYLKSCPLEAGELQVISLGKIVKNTDNFQTEGLICPDGYTALRKFPSTTDPSVLVLYKMEVLRDVGSMTRPLFRVTTDNGEEFKGSTPSACWNKIYKRVKKAQISNHEDKAEQIYESGSYMFGFTHPEVSKLIKEMLNSSSSSKSFQSASLRTKDFPVGFRPVHVEWRDLDKCNVCHMDEEYENNLFLQCDKCRMMVHARCYGELEPTGGILWLCNLCRPGAPESPPPCCLCPVIGGAMKPTTDGRWAHLACAIWIPETCLSDIKKMEPIDGLRRINKDRWKLLCSICGVSYGACIQCSNHNCHVAYHPLCARAAGFCLEPDDVDRLHLVPFEEDEDDQCIQLISFCRKHRPSTNVRLASDERIGQKASDNVDYCPPPNPSGCARTEPYNFLQRQGRNGTDFPALVSSKRLYVENRPYLVGGCSTYLPLGNMFSNALGGTKYSLDIKKLQATELDPSDKIVSLADKYNHMRNTFRKRLAFGKSGIHGFGVFTKLPHRAGDMVIEYTGELIRPPVADRREHLIYNSLVGAGTYMFRIDDQRVIDATRAGSIAHLINHSCEPNCYSRVISINVDDHIIIFAKRDIKQWEELTYDYRFFSIDEQLACYCGYSRCRGVVNDTEAEERVAKLSAPLGELKDWQGE